MRTSLKFPLIALSVVSLLSLGVRAQSSKPLRITTDTKNSVQHIEKIIFGALNNQGIMIPETTVSVSSKDGKVTVDGSLNTDITVNVGKDLTMSSLIGGWLNTLLEAKWSSLIGGKMNQMRSQFNTLWGGVNNTLTGETIYGVMIAGEGNQLSGGQSVLLGGSGNRLEGKINTLINANHTQLRGQNNLLLGVHNANISGEHLFVWGNLDSLEADRLMFLGGKLAIKTPTPHQDAMITLSGDLRIAENTNKNNEITNTPEYSGAIKTVSKEGFFCSCSFDGEKWNPMIKDSLLCQVLCAGEEDRSRRPKPGECGPAQGKNFNNLWEILPDQACQMGIVAELNQQGNSYHWKCEGINRGPSASCTACAPAGEWNPLTKLCDTRAPKPGECWPAQGKSFNNLWEILPEQACKSGTMEALNKLETQYEWNCKGEYGGASVTCHACTAETVWNPATKSCDTRQYGLEICRHKGDLSAFLLQRRWKPSEACETLPQKYTKDQPLNLQTPKLTGHTFYGRSTDPSCQGTKWSSSSPFVREENTKLYACRHPNTYQIHYDKQGGQRSSAPDTTSKQVTYGEIIGELRRDIVKENHTFTDWYDHTNGTSGTGKVYQTNQRYTVPGDSTAYAAWTPNLPTPQNPQSAGTGRLQLYLCDPEGNYVFTEKTKPAGTKEEIKATQYQLTIYLDPQGWELPENKRKVIFYKPLRGWEVTNGGTVSNQSDNAITYTYATGEVGIIKERCDTKEQSKPLPTPINVCAEFKWWIDVKEEKLVEQRYVVSPTEYAKKEIYLHAQREGGGENEDNIIIYYEKDEIINKEGYSKENEIKLWFPPEKEKENFLGRYRDPELTDGPYKTLPKNTCGEKSFRAKWEKLEDMQEIPHVRCDTLPDMNISGIVIKPCNQGAEYLGEPGKEFTDKNYTTTCPYGYHVPTLAEWRSLFAVAGSRVGFEEAYRHWTGIVFTQNTFNKLMNGTPTMSGLYLYNPGIYRSKREGESETGSIQIKDTDILNPRYRSEKINFSTGMVRCFRDCWGICSFQYYLPPNIIIPTPEKPSEPELPPVCPEGCDAWKCQGLTQQQKASLSWLTKEEQLKKLCPTTGDLQHEGGEVIYDDDQNIIWWNCYGNCKGEAQTLNCSLCQIWKCQKLSQQEQQNLSGMSEEEKIAKLCPTGAGSKLKEAKIRYDADRNIIWWDCYGECQGESQKMNCTICPTLKCPQLTDEEKESLTGKKEEEMKDLLCPTKEPRTANFSLPHPNEKIARECYYQGCNGQEVKLMCPNTKQEEEEDNQKDLCLERQQKQKEDLDGMVQDIRYILQECGDYDEKNQVTIDKILQNLKTNTPLSSFEESLSSLENSLKKCTNNSIDSKRRILLRGALQAWRESVQKGCPKNCEEKEQQEKELLEILKDLQMLATWRNCTFPSQIPEQIKMYIARGDSWQKISSSISSMIIRIDELTYFSEEECMYVHNGSVITGQLTEEQLSIKAQRTELAERLKQWKKEHNQGCFKNCQERENSKKEELINLWKRIQIKVEEQMQNIDKEPINCIETVTNIITTTNIAWWTDEFWNKTFGCLESCEKALEINKEYWPIKEHLYKIQKKIKEGCPLGKTSTDVGNLPWTPNESCISKEKYEEAMDAYKEAKEKYEKEMERYKWEIEQKLKKMAQYDERYKNFIKRQKYTQGNWSIQFNLIQEGYKPPETVYTTTWPCYQGFERKSFAPPKIFVPDRLHAFLSPERRGRLSDRNCMGYHIGLETIDHVTCMKNTCSQAMFPKIRYINGGVSTSRYAMTNPTYNPIGFGVGFCGYGACDYECAEEYHWDAQATGNVFQEAKGEKGNCVYNYRYCSRLPSVTVRWTTGSRIQSYNAWHLDASLWPHAPQTRVGNIAQEWDPSLNEGAGGRSPQEADTTPRIYAGNPTERCRFDCIDPLTMHRDERLRTCVSNREYCNPALLPENAVWNTGEGENIAGDIRRYRTGVSWTGGRIPAQIVNEYKYTNTGDNTAGNACTFRCKDEHLLSGYHRDPETQKCVLNHERCQSLPSNAEWYSGFNHPTAAKIFDRVRSLGVGRVPEKHKPYGYYQNISGATELSTTVLTSEYCLFTCKEEYHRESEWERGRCLYNWKPCDDLPFTGGIEFVEKETNKKVRYKQMRTWTWRWVVHPTVHESHTGKHQENKNCVYKCVSWSHRSGNDCKQNKEDCEEKPESTNWCIAKDSERYKRLWNDEGMEIWGGVQPTKLSRDCTDQSKCAYRCSESYHRSGNDCKQNKEDCEEKPESTNWCIAKDSERYKRLWNDEGMEIWSGEQPTKLSRNCTDQSKCAYRCLTWSHRSGNACTSNKEECKDKPEGTNWCIAEDSKRYKRLWNDEGMDIWGGEQPTVFSPYCTDDSKCTFKCRKTKIYDPVTNMCICKEGEQRDNNAQECKVIPICTCEELGIRGAICKNAGKAGATYNNPPYKGNANDNHCWRECPNGDVPFEEDGKRTCESAYKSCPPLEKGEKRMNNNSHNPPKYRITDATPKDGRKKEYQGAENNPCRFECTDTYHRNANNNKCENNERELSCSFSLWEGQKWKTGTLQKVTYQKNGAKWQLMEEKTIPNNRQWEITKETDDPGPSLNKDEQKNICVRTCKEDEGYFASGNECKPSVVLFRCNIPPKNGERSNDNTPREFPYQRFNNSYQYTPTAKREDVPVITIGKGKNDISAGMNYNPSGNLGILNPIDANSLTPSNGMCPRKCRQKNMKLNAQGTDCEIACTGGMEYKEPSNVTDQGYTSIWGNWGPWYKQENGDIYILWTGGCQMAIKDHNQGATVGDRGKFKLDFSITGRILNTVKGRMSNFGSGNIECTGTEYYTPHDNDRQTLFQLMNASRPFTWTDSRLMEILQLPWGIVFNQKSKFWQDVHYYTSGGQKHLISISDGAKLPYPSILYTSWRGSNTLRRCFKALSQRET